MIEPVLIIQVAHGSRVDVQLSDNPPAAVTGREVVVEVGPTDAEGALEAEVGGEVVLSVPAPEAFARDPDALHRVLAEAGTGTEPLVVVVEAADELTDADLGLVLGAARRAPRPVILRIVRDG
ncbi:MAG TPA: hypothetical protein VMD09_12485 [Solirubrobacteraceae bacterium]|nr:hypothetical protein [Solirubrobacteraceae bacterium]